jgi:hypothetical protein
VERALRDRRWPAALIGAVALAVGASVAAWASTP